MNPRVSLVIATYNRAQALDRLLRQLPDQTLEPALWEVVVVDDGGTDDTLQRLQAHQALGRMQLTFFSQPNSGPAGARHRGILAARAAWVVITDDDMELAPDYLAAHLAAGAGPAATVVFGSTRTPSDWRTKPLFDAVGEFKLSRLHRRFLAGEVVPGPQYMATGNVSFPRALYDAVGGFDLSLRIDEDRELGFRFGQAGARFVFAPAAWCIHHSDIGAYAAWRRRQFNYGLAAAKVWRKHGEAASLHPLANLMDGDPAKRLAVMIACRYPWLRHATVAALAAGGKGLRRLGLFRAAIGAYQLIESIEYHGGLTQVYGSWQQVLDAAWEYRDARR